jgi:cysteine desulfuration protein SufE
VPAKLDALIDELKDADREERIELLLDLAKGLPPLPDRLAAHKDAAHRVEECQSPVFLFVEPNGSTVRIFADAPIEAPTVRGFVALLVEGLDGATLAEVLSVPNDLVDRSGMTEILGMLRVRGLTGVLRRLKSDVTKAMMPAAEPPSRSPSADAPTESTPMADHETILAALRTVKDPEVGVNVVDLGLVYTIQTRENEVDIEMTLTTPACPAGPEILRNAVTALEQIEGVSKANVKLVMSPPWSPDRMTDAARDELGIF